ncbi:MAG: BadF/BadG/BcrA/BcrD ATPase family protein [Patescibacteria group bacterium]
MHYYLGVDGGGTSTAAAIANEHGKVVGTGIAGPSLYKVAGLKGAMENIRKALFAAEKKACVKFPSYAYAVFGLSGVDSLQDWQMLSQKIFKHFKKKIGDRFRVVNDVVIALAAGTDKPYGVAVIAGTGSNAYAVGPKGEAYAGGLGSLLSDEGSAYAIGSETLRAAVKSFDGRGGRSALEPLLCRQLGVKNMREAVDKVYTSSFNKTSLAALAPLCVRAAHRGDKVARSIVAHAALELGSMACAVIRRSGLSSRAFDLILWGGVFQAGDILLSSFKKAVHHTAPKVHIVLLKKPPYMGALKLARGM